MPTSCSKQDRRTLWSTNLKVPVLQNLQCSLSFLFIDGRVCECSSLLRSETCMQRGMFLCVACFLSSGDEPLHTTSTCRKWSCAGALPRRSLTVLWSSVCQRSAAASCYSGFWESDTALCRPAPPYPSFLNTAG